MASALSPEYRKCFEDMLNRASPYTEEDPEYHMWDGDVDLDRMMATMAKKMLDEADGNT